MALTGCSAGSRSLEAGADAQVVVDELLVRDDPGTSATASRLLADGTELEITGEVTSIEGMDWWPVRFDQDEVNGHRVRLVRRNLADDNPGLFGGIRELFERASRRYHDSLRGLPSCSSTSERKQWRILRRLPDYR